MDNLLSMFGLNKEQLEILYSIERILTKDDIANNPKTAIIRENWLNQWINTIDMSVFSKSDMHIYRKGEIFSAIHTVSQKSASNTWFYLVMLEATLFSAYFPIDEDKENIKKYSKLKYKQNIDFLKLIAESTGLMDSKYIDRYIKTYNSSYDKISGRRTKVVAIGLGIVALAAVGAALAAVFAGPIAIAIFGAGFELNGAALTAACLAMAGGGAISIGGGGMAMGVIAIAGGGALLGAASGGAAAATVTALAKGSPEFTLTQTARLEVVLREILLNVQHDTETAQMVISRLQEQMLVLQKELNNLEIERKNDKEAINNLKKSIDMIKKAAQDMVVFKSAFEDGLKIQGN